MSDIGGREALQRMEIAASQYIGWETADLWDELGLLTDEAWEGRETVDGPDQDVWAKRESIGLALIDRGATAAEIATGLTPERFRRHL